MLVVSHNSGRLGNRLFYFAHFIAYNFETQEKIIGLFFGEYGKYFVGTQKNTIGLYPKSKWLYTNRLIGKFIYKFLTKLEVIVIEKELNNFLFSFFPPYEKDEKGAIYYSVDKLTESMSSKRSLITFYKGGFEGYDLTDLSKYKNLIKEYFRPIKIIENRVNSFLKEKQNIADIVIGVHLRKGDYKTWFDGKLFFPDEVYLDKINQMEKLFSNKRTLYILVSDEPINKNILKGNITAGIGEIIEDLYTLAGCDYIIGTSSTFSMWASFYGDVPIYEIRNPDDVIELSKFYVVKDRTNEFMYW